MYFFNFHSESAQQAEMADITATRISHVPWTRKTSDECSTIAET